MHVRVCIYVCMYVCMYVHTVYTYIYIHTHTFGVPFNCLMFCKVQPARQLFFSRVAGLCFREGLARGSTGCT